VAHAGQHRERAAAAGPISGAIAELLAVEVQRCSPARFLMAIAPRNALRVPLTFALHERESAALNIRRRIGTAISDLGEVGGISTAFLIRLIERIHNRFPRSFRTTAASAEPPACVQMKSLKEPLDPSP
jgi:hypothetical protein